MPIAYDGIELNIQASATKAIQQLDLLVGRLNSVVSTLHGINTASFSGLANGVTELSTAMSGLKETATSKDFTNLAKNVNKLAGINASGLRESASAIKEINAAITGVNVPEASAANIKSMTDAMSSFGYERMNKAAANLPIFATEFKNLLTTIASAPEASQNVISLVSAIGSAANGMAALSGKSGAAIGGSSSLWGNFAANLKKSATSLRDFVKNAISARAASSRLGSGIDRLAYTFGKLYASLFLVVRALKGIGSAIKSAMDYVETFNYYNVTMNKIGSQFADNYAKYGYDSAQAYSDSFSKRMNELSAKMTGFNIGKNGEMSFTNKMNLALDPELVMNYEAQVASVTNSVGLMGETSLNAAKALTMLAADYSSLRNIDLKTVMTNFSSGLIGQSRALYKYGIDITNATLQTYAYKYGIKTAVSEMTQSDKMQLRLIAILDQSKVAWGDQANTINSVANQYRILKAQGANLARMFGSLFIPMLQSVLPYINAVVMGLQRLVQWVATIFHIDMGKNMAGISKAYSGGADDMEGLADASDDASDSLDKANGSAKALAKTVLGFDEINALSDNSSKDGKGSGGGIDLSGPIGDALNAYNDAWNKSFNNSTNKAQELLDKLMKYVKAGDWKGLGTLISTKLRDALNSIPWDKVYSAAENFGKGLADFLNGLIRPDTFYAIGKTIAGALNTGLHFLDSFAVTLDWKNLGLSIANGINGFFQNFDFKLFAKTLNDWVHGFEDTISTALKNIDYKAVFKGLADFFKELSPDTFLWIVGLTFGPGIAKAMGAAIVKSVSKKILQGLIGAALGAGVGGTIAFTFTAIATIAVVTKFVGDYKNWKKNIEQYGPTTGKQVTALENDANPYESTSKKGQFDQEGFLGLNKKLQEWKAQNRQVRSQDKQEHYAYIDDLNKKTSDYLDGQKKKYATWGANVKTTVLDTYNNAKTSASSYLDGQNEKLNGFATNVESAFGKAKASVTNAGAIMAADVGKIPAAFSEAGIKAGTFIATNIQPGLTSFAQKVSALPSNVSVGLETLKTNVGSAATQAGTWLSTNFNAGKDSFLSKVASLPGTANRNISPVIEYLRSAGSNAINGLHNGFNNGIGDFINTVGSIPGRIYNALSGMYNIGQSIIRSLINGLQSINIPTPHFYFGSTTKRIAGHNIDFPSISFDGWYANGGFPSTGDIFVANEKAPELVGKMGNRTTVANNAQITEGIKSAVEEAMANVMIAFSSKDNNNSTTPVEVTIVASNETLYRQVQKGKLSYDGRVHVVVPV